MLYLLKGGDYMPVMPESKRKIEIFCPNCGSNQVNRVEDKSSAQYWIGAIVFTLLGIILAPGAIIFIPIAIFNLIVAIITMISNITKKNTHTTDKDIWTFHCAMCKKNFTTPVSKGDVGIINGAPLV